MIKRSEKKRLILLDAHAIIHRAYHALPDFTSPKGEPTGALYGLSSMLLRIISDLEPDYLAACYDLPKPTVRHEAYSDYKATRAKTEDNLVHQIISSRRVFEAFCIPIYEREGFEADDLLGTIVEMTKNDANTEVIIASGDMDTLQLVDGKRVQVYTLKRGLNDTILYDERAVEERFGFPAHLIPDWKGLRGDPSDNIKGVPGIGEKTATDLIVGFGTLENLFATLKKDEQQLIQKGIKPRMVELLKKHEEEAMFSKMLATIRRDAPIAFRLPEARWQEHPDLGKIRVLFEELGFRSLRPRLEALIGAPDFEDEMEESDGEGGDTAVEEIPELRFREAQVMLWLLHSEFTNPGKEDILAYANARKFSDAYDYLLKELDKTGRVKNVYEEIEKPLVPVIIGMEKCGVLIDRKTLNMLHTEYSKELQAVEKKIFKAAGREFNVSSPKQLAEVLFDDLELVVKGQKKTAGGQRSTRESELEKIRDLHPIVDDILEYREIQKLLSTYIDAMEPLLDGEDRLHASFIQTGTTTGRMASANPNLQNIPIRTERGRKIRKAFIARKGFSLVALDYSQIELRLAAILSKDEKLCTIFREGRDIHTEVASMVFNVPPDKVDYEMRRRSKIINFGILYGMGANALKTQLGSTIAEAHKYLDDYHATFARLTEYMEETKGFARKHGYTETLYGRRRPFPEMKSPLPYVRAQAERMAINAPMQGTQSDIIKLAMVRVDDMLTKENSKKDAHLLLQVHDELVYEVKDEKIEKLGREIEHIMQSVLPIEEANGVPIIAQARVGDNWDEMRPL